MPPVASMPPGPARLASVTERLPCVTRPSLNTTPSPDMPAASVSFWRMVMQAS